MRTVVVMGGNIGKAIAQNRLASYPIFNISRSLTDGTHEYLTHFSCNFTYETLSTFEKADGLICSAESIHHEPKNRLSLDDVKEDFEIHVFGVVKCIQSYLSILKAGIQPIFCSEIRQGLSRLYRQQ